MQRWSLTVYAPNQAPRSHECDESPLIVGSQNAQGVLVLGVPGVAARHALLHVQGGILRVEALDPAAAVFVQGTAISEPVETGCPASIRIGDVELKITVAAEMAEARHSIDATLRVVHPTWVSARPMAFPSSPEMTGRIYAAELEKAHEGMAAPFKAPAEDEAPGVEGEESPTLTFSFEGDEVPIADTLSLAVDYATQTEIARGGMGKIFSAEDATLGRIVALKVSAVKDPKQDAQFFREARVLARLAHPHIVPIHNFGRDNLGRPFYSMKLVKGRTLQAIIKQLQLGAADTGAVFTRQRLLEVFRKVCDAVSFAHAQGVLHRDLKPENIMVGEYGEVLVMDWGLAKDFPNTAGAGTRDTREEAEPETLPYVEGTPQYMSPEQAAGMYGGLDQRSDLYALGGILFAILTLRPAVKGGSVHDVLRKVCNGELETMTLPVENVGELKHGAMTRVVPEALRAVTLKALAKNREDRYPSVEALVADIEAYQGGFATVAEQATVFRQMTLFVKRHRAASALAAVLLVAGGVFTVRLAASERRAQNNALRAERESQSALANARLAQASAHKAEEQARRAEENAARAVAEKEAARKATAAASMANAEAAEDTRNAESIRNALDAVQSDLRTQQWEYLHAFVDSSKQTIVAKNKYTWKECVPHPQKPGVFVTLQQDNWVRLLNLNDGSTEDVSKLEGAFSFGSLAVSEDAEKLAVISSTRVSPGVYASSLEILRFKDGKSLRSIPISNGQNTVLKFSADGRLLLKTHRRAWLPGAEPALFDVETGVACWPASYAGIYAADFVPPPSAASKTLVFWASKSIGLVEIDPLSDQTLKPPVKFPVPQGLELFLSGTGLFGTTEDGIMRRINPLDGNAMYEFRLPGRLRSVRDAVFLQKHNLLISLVPIAERSAVLDLRDAQSGAAIASFPMVLDGIGGAREWMLTAHPASGHVAVFRGNTMKVWKVGRTTGVITDKIDGLSAPGFTFFGDTNKVVQVSIKNKPIAGQRTHQLEIRQPVDDRLSLERELGAERIEANFPVVLSPSRDANAVGILTQSGTGFSIKTLHFEGGSPRMTAPTENFSPRYGFFLMSPDGAQIWGGTGIFDAATGVKRQELVRTRVEKGADSYSFSLACWTDNAHVVELCTVLGDSEELERALVVWSTSEAKFVHWVPAPHARAVAASPDGAALAEAGSDQRVRIRDASTLEVNRVLRVHDAPVADVAWNPKRPYLATAGEDFRVRIWDLDSGRMLEEMGFLETLPAQLHWSPDGRTLAVRGQPVNRGGSEARRYFFFPKCCNPE